MFKGLASDLTGSSDICRPVRDLAKSHAAAYVLPGEAVLFTLQSAKEEFAFTSQALLLTVGLTATTTRRLVTRYDYKHYCIKNVRFETAGRVDRDCEIKFELVEKNPGPPQMPMTINGLVAAVQHGSHKNLSIDVARDEEATALVYYKVIEVLARAILSNATDWGFVNSSLINTATALRLGDRNNSGLVLSSHSNDTLLWMQKLHGVYNPQCYSDVILEAFNTVQGLPRAA